MGLWGIDSGHLRERYPSDPWRGNIASRTWMPMKAFPHRILLACSLLGWCICSASAQQSADSNPGTKIFPGADEKTPSRSEYFTWINQTDEGPDEAQTLANLAFFKYLHDEYGMQLDIYAFDEGAIDHALAFESMDSPRFKGNFPNGFDASYQAATTMGTRLGLWSGADGFGDTPETEKARTDMFVKLCRDYHWGLFKFDAVRGPLRPEKQDAFANMLIQCRQVDPDLIVLNHRLDLGKAAPYATTQLWEGQETYIDVHMGNSKTGIHNRVDAIARGLPPNLTRMVEDHGVCLSSCLDFWDDDLVLQAFNRSLTLAPEIYGNPWFLRDDEFPKLARLFNLHRRYGAILVNGLELPESTYGPHAVSRGDDSTRFLTLRNLTWEPVKYKVKLDSSIGLTASGDVAVREFHPVERDVGSFAAGSEVEVEVPAFRSFLLMASTKPIAEVGVSGVDYQVERDVAGKPLQLKLLGQPGTQASVKLLPGAWTISAATLDGQPANDLAQGKEVAVDFPGTASKEPYHRKLGDLAPADVPPDAEALYEATAFAASNDALEYQCITRSGPTKIPAVQAARDAFFHHRALRDRSVWSGALFDGDVKTQFRNGGSDNQLPSETAFLRIDFGAPVKADKFVITVEGDNQKPGTAELSADLETWTPAETTVVGKTFVIKSSPNAPVRYLRIWPGDWRLCEVEGFLGDTPLDRTAWHATNLFQDYSKDEATAAWTGNFQLSEPPPPGSYLCVALEGKHGPEGAWAALRVDGHPVGATTRAPSFPFNPWEAGGGHPDGNTTYFFPVTPDLATKPFDVVVLTLAHGVNTYKPQVWITAYPTPAVAKELLLQAAAK